MARKKKRLTAKQKNRRRWLFEVLVLLLVAILVNVVKYNFLTIKEIKVEGNRKVSQEEILKAGKIDVGTQLYGLNDKKVLKRIEAIPFIKTAQLKKHLNGSLVLHVEERKPIAQLNFRDHYVNVDEDLRILEKTMQFQPDFIKINGLTIKGLRMGSYLFLNEKQKDLRTMVTTIFQGDLKDKIQAIDIQTQEVHLLTKDDIQVIFSSTKDSQYKCKQLVAVLEKIKSMDKEVTMILMDKGKDPVAVTESQKTTVNEGLNRQENQEDRKED